MLIVLIHLYLTERSDGKIPTLQPPMISLVMKRKPDQKPRKTEPRVKKLASIALLSFRDDIDDEY